MDLDLPVGTIKQYATLTAAQMECNGHTFVPLGSTADYVCTKCFVRESAFTATLAVVVNQSKDWFEAKIAAEGDLDVAAGSQPYPSLPSKTSVFDWKEGDRFIDEDGDTGVVLGITALQVRYDNPRLNGKAADGSEDTIASRRQIAGWKSIQKEK